jgi:DNA-binding MarR family transcriptional regulator
MSARTAAKTRLVPLVIADIYQLAGEFRARAQAIAAAAGQSQARWQVLSAASTVPMTVPQIARRLGVTRQGVQRLGNLLARERLATLEVNPDHRASPYLALTAKGRQILAQLTKDAAAHNARLAQHLGTAELAAIHDGLRRLITILDRSKGAQ